MLEEAPAYGVSRAKASVIQFRNDMVKDIEGKDAIGETIYATRNAAVAGWHALQNIIPSILNSVSGQTYNVVERSGTFHGTRNSMNKVLHTKGIIGKASAVFVEATDGPVDDGLNVVGGSKWIVEPSYSTAA